MPSRRVLLLTASICLVLWLAFLSFHPPAVIHLLLIFGFACWVYSFGETNVQDEGIGFLRDGNGGVKVRESGLEYILDTLRIKRHLSSRQ